MWPIKEKENRQLLIIVAKSYEGIRRYGSLININPSGPDDRALEKYVVS